MADHESAAALCLKMGIGSCKALREANAVTWVHKGLSAADLTTLATLGLVLPALEDLTLIEKCNMRLTHPAPRRTRNAPLKRDPAAPRVSPRLRVVSPPAPQRRPAPTPAR